MVAAPAFPTALSPSLNPAVCSRALDARDARFDGLFFVGITTTRIYCRPVCPARVSYHERRRFFDSAASAERAGFRPCLRCRPELAPGRAVIDAVPNLARVAAHRIAAGALNGRDVAHLASELGVSDRHLRRVLERELGVSPLELAQTHRLLLAKRLLADTSLPVTRIAYASGFQSLRRFNSVFRERYRLRPSALRRQLAASAPVAGDLVRLTLAYRAPFAWEVLVGQLARTAVPGVEAVDGGRWARTVRLEGRTGIVLVERPPADPRTHLLAHVSASLLPVLMPLLARLRQLLDLDAESAAVDAHLARGGLGRYVARRPGLRMPGAFDGFEAALRVLLGGGPGAAARVARVAFGYGEPFDAGLAGLVRLGPEAARMAGVRPAELAALGVPLRRARAIVAVARALAAGTVWLEPGSDARAAQRTLRGLDGMDAHLATAIVSRALHWPDAFPASDRALQRMAHASSARELLARAEAWRPWRGYAALHLRLEQPDR
jgi:AraC family transcriptional regulator of adaptative response / DNA-3-methyladenine glycosylase II